MQKPFNAKQIHILNVAEELIAQNGFENTSVREISKNANINVAMISYYFGSKEKMMTCLYEYRIQRSKEKFSELTQILGNIRPEIQIKEIITSAKAKQVRVLFMQKEFYLVLMKMLR